MGSINRELDEVQNHINHMGETLGTYYNSLWNEVTWLFSKWSEYDELFGKKPSRIDLLNDAAPTFFYIVQDCLFKDIILHIARLTDPSKSGRKENLSIRGLPSLISSDNLKIEVKELIDEALKKAKFIRDWRNRTLAHKDLRLSMADEAVPLQPASRKKVKDVLESLSSIMNVIAKEYMDTTIIFDGLGKIRGAEALLFIIDDGIKAGKRRRERITSKNFTDDDIKIRNL